MKKKLTNDDDIQKEYDRQFSMSYDDFLTEQDENNKDLINDHVWKEGGLLNEDDEPDMQPLELEDEESEGEANLNDIPDTTITFEAPFTQLCKMFDITSWEDIEEYISMSITLDSSCGRDNLDDVDGVDVTKVTAEDADEYEFDEDEQEIFDEEGYCYLDRNNKVIDWGTVDTICQYVNDACQIGAERNVREQIHGIIESIFGTFSDFHYEYDALGEQSYEGFIGTAKGYQSMTWEYGEKDEMAKIVVYADFVHIINAMITGVGTFDVDVNLEGESIHEYIQSRWKQIRYYGEIYGHRFNTEVTLNTGYDREGLIESLKQLEQSTQYKLYS